MNELVKNNVRQGIFKRQTWVLLFFVVLGISSILKTEASTPNTLELNKDKVVQALVLYNSTTNQTTDFHIKRVKMVLTQKGYNLTIEGQAEIDGEKRKGSCVIQSFKSEVILPIYQAIYNNFNSLGPKGLKVECSSKTIEGPAIVLLDMGQGDLSVEHF
jgi:hypothetical protein